MTTTTYYFRHDWPREVERLRQLEAFWDPFTQANIERLGVPRGARCLEVGAGGGSIAKWLAQRVGAEGHVTAVDIETRLLTELACDNLTVRELRVGSDALERDHYDLIHARAVMEHLANPERALADMVAALRPGGVLLLESSDFSTFGPANPEHESLFERVWQGLGAVLLERGFHTDCGRRLLWRMPAAGLEAIDFHAQLVPWGGGGVLTDFYAGTFERLAMGLRESDKALADDVARLLTLLHNPSFRALSHTTCAVSGRRPLA